MTYFHTVPGRLRIKIPGLRRNLRLGKELHELLNRLSGVRSTSANILTGSLVVTYDPKMISSGSILTFLSRERYIDLAKPVRDEQHADDVFARVGEAACKAVIGIALDRALKDSPLSILAALI